MQRVIACILLLAICAPYLVISKKVMLTLPQHIRRNPAYSARSPLIAQPSYHAKRSYYPNVPKRPYTPASIHYGKPKPFAYDKSKLPHGGDDFDQGHEPVRHHTVPHGKGISHGISYGRGYIPYGKIKSDFTRYRPGSIDHSYTHQTGPGPTATEALHPSSQSSHHSQSSFTPSKFFPASPEYSEDSSNQAHAAELVGNPSQSVNFIAQKGETHFKPSTFLQNVPVNVERNPPNQNQEFHHHQQIQHQNKNVAPHRSKAKGIVISDSVLLDEYTKKVEEFTNSWPKIVANNQAAQTSQQIAPGYVLGALNIPVAQGRKGYAVHEDINEPHTNYRAGIVNSPFLAGQTTKNIGVSSLISVQG